MPLSIQDSLIDSNDAGVDDFAPGAGNPNGSGGGVYVANGGTNGLTMSDSTVSDNHAGENTGTGGGIEFNSPGNLNVTDSVIYSNEAELPGGGGTGRGGGIHRAETMGTPSDTIVGSVISNNAAGGSAVRGGGIAAQTNGTMSIRDSSVTFNTATSCSASGIGGSLALDGGTSGGTFTVENVTVHGNVANDAATFAGGAGGGIAVGEAGATTTVVTINHSTITNNTAEFPAPPGGGNLRTADPAGSIVLRASIVSAGISDPGEENCSEAVAGGIDSQGFNVEGSPSVITQCDLGGGADVVSDPLLSAALVNGPSVGASASPLPLTARTITATSPAFNRVTAGCPPPAAHQFGHHPAPEPGVRLRRL